LLVLKASTLIDGNGGDVLTDPVVLIDEGRIKEIGASSRVSVPQDAEIVDMAGCTLMPGLIDCHMHSCGMNVLSFRNHRVAEFETPPQLQMLYALLHVQMCFEMGFTTIRDLGWIGYAGLLTAELCAIRDAINQGLFAGPRLLVGGFTSITGSHLDLIMPRNMPRQPGVTADGPWELRKLARENLRIGCDVIKTCASGGGGTDKESPDVRNMTQEELNAIVEEAHFFRKPAAVHCFTPEAQRMAVRAGADTIEHSVFTDDEAIAMIKAENIPVVPTLAHRTDRAIEARRRAGTSEFILRKMKSIQPSTEQTFRRFHQAGIRIAMGTDTQIDPEMGSNALELEIYVKFGMTPMEAIQTATRNAAEAIWLGDETGTLQPGKYADIIAVDGDPLADIRLLQDRDRIRLVMKEGQVHVDRRPGQNRHVVHDQSWGWKPA
jgi:imidazolonepropionase-like amidohydrolase